MGFFVVGHVTCASTHIPYQLIPLFAHFVVEAERLRCQPCKEILHSFIMPGGKAKHILLAFNSGSYISHRLHSIEGFLEQFLAEYQVVANVVRVFFHPALPRRSSRPLAPGASLLASASCSLWSQCLWPSPRPAPSPRSLLPPPVKKHQCNGPDWASGG